MDMIKKKKYSIIAAFIIVVSAGYMGDLPAKIVSSINSFYREIGKRQFAVVMLYRSDKKLRKSNRELYDQIKDAISTFNSLKNVRTYEKSDVRFVQVNVTKGNLDTLPTDLNIVVQQQPVYILFVDGKLVKSPTKVRATAQGFLTIEQLRDFIDSNTQNQMQDYIDEKEEREHRARERSRMYVGFGGYPWYGAYPYHGGWGYPYWGYGYGGRVGFGIGFGF